LRRKQRRIVAEEILEQVRKRAEFLREVQEKFPMEAEELMEEYDRRIFTFDRRG
jgi:hypothetical protein